jgi:hypothetical protein
VILRLFQICTCILCQFSHYFEKLPLIFSLLNVCSLCMPKFQKQKLLKCFICHGIMMSEKWSNEVLVVYFVCSFSLKLYYNETYVGWLHVFKKLSVVHLFIHGNTWNYNNKLWLWNVNFKAQTFFFAHAAPDVYSKWNILLPTFICQEPGSFHWLLRTSLGICSFRYL